MIGTKPMVFPLDADGRVYVLHNENDEPVCTGSRETCYRLLNLMLQVKQHVDEIEVEVTRSTEGAELFLQAASVASAT